MVSINIVGLTEGTLIQRAHVCTRKLTEACKQIDYTDVPCTPAMLPKNDGQSESEDGRHRRASLHLCHSANPSLSSHPLRHSTSRQTPPPKPSPCSVRQSPLFPFSACLLSSTRAISFFLPFLLLLHFVWLNRGGETKKKDGKWVYVFLGLCCDGIVCPVTQALEDAPAFLCKTRMAWKVLHSKFSFKSPRSPPPTPLPSWYYCWRCRSKDWRITFCFPQNSNHQQHREFIHSCS